MSLQSKIEDVNDVVDSLTNHWNMRGFGTNIKSKRTIADKIQTILNTYVYKKLEYSVHSSKHFDFDWINEKQEFFKNKDFDLTKGMGSSKQVKRPYSQEDVYMVRKYTFFCINRVKVMLFKICNTPRIL